MISNFFEAELKIDDSDIVMILMILILNSHVLVA